MTKALDQATTGRSDPQVVAQGAGWFHVFAFALIADVAVFGALGRPTELGLGGGLLVLGLVFTRLGQFKSVKGFGLEAEMLERKLERAEKVTSEAFATARQLRELAKALAGNALALTSQIGLWSTMPLTERLKAAEEIRGALGSLGLSEREVEAISAPIRQVARHQLARRVEDACNASGTWAVMSAEFHALANWGERFVAPASEFASIASKHAVTGEVLEAIADLEFFDREGKLRRPDKWDFED